MKFMCDVHISKSRMETINDAIELFEELMSRLIIRFDKTDELRNLITKCTNNKVELIEKIDQFEKSECLQNTYQNSSSTQEDRDQCPLQVQTRKQDLKREIQLLVDNLGKNWKFFIRHLDVPESELELKLQQNQSNIKEAIYACFYYWLSEMGNGKKTKEEIIEEWIKTLGMLGRNDLIEKLKSLS